MLENFNNNYIINEKNMSYGDYVIVFPNPDHANFKRKNQRFINFTDALKVFNRAFLFEIVS
jgi:hypothetical protein